MRKLVLLSATLASLAPAVPALAQGVPAALLQTRQSDVKVASSYGENHGGWLTDLLFGKSDKSRIAQQTAEAKPPAQ